MKRKHLLMLLLAAVLCLILVGCGGKQLPEEQLAELYGTWVCNGPVMGDLGNTLTLSEGGVCDLGDGMEYTWGAKESKESEEIITVEFRQGKKLAYTMEVYTQQDGTYKRVDGHLRDAKDDFQDTYTLAPAAPDEPWFELAYTRWTPSRDWDNEREVDFRADGTCNIDGTEYNWCVEPFSVWSGSEVYAMVYNETGSYYYLLFVEQSGYPHMQMEEGNLEQRDFVGTYLFHPMLAMLTEGGTWRAFDLYNSVNEHITFYTEGAWVGDKEFNWVITGVTEDSLDIAIPNAHDSEYTCTLMVENDYPNLALKCVSTGEEVHYYGAEYGYDGENPEAIYCFARNAIQRYLEDEDYRPEGTEDWLEEEQLLAYAHTQLLKVSDYKQAGDDLANFTVLEKQLVRVALQTEDKLGNQKETKRRNVICYDAQGRVVQTNLNDHAEGYGLSTDGVLADFKGYNLHLFYDEAGVMHKLEVQNGNNTIEAKCIPTYEDGKLVRMDVQTASEDRQATFSYDDQGRISTANLYKGTIKYSYDEAGRLIQKTLKNGRSDYSTVIDYVYDESGVLVQEVRKQHAYSNNWTEMLDYSYDAEGDLVCISATSDKDGYQYVKEELHYIYENVYFYAEG